MAAHWAHGTAHGARAGGDSLSLYGEEKELLLSAFAEWDGTRLDKGPDPGQSVAAEKYDNGTIGKLVLEHTALFVAAVRDLRTGLSAAGRHDLEQALGELVEQVAPRLGRVDELARGTAPVSLAGNADFVEALTQLRVVLQPALLGLPGAEELGQALGERRRDLRSLRWLRKHAPTAFVPGRWYDRVPLLLRLHTALDRGRGFPWAESRPMSSPQVADRYDRQVK